MRLSDDGSMRTTQAGRFLVENCFPKCPMIQIPSLIITTGMMMSRGSGATGEFASLPEKESKSVSTSPAIDKHLGEHLGVPRAWDLSNHRIHRPAGAPRGRAWLLKRTLRARRG